MATGKLTVCLEFKNKFLRVHTAPSYFYTVLVLGTCSDFVTKERQTVGICALDKVCFLRIRKAVFVCSWINFMHSNLTLILVLLLERRILF